MKLRTRILLFLILLSLLPILVFLFFNIHSQQEKLNEQVRQAGQTASAQSALQLNHSLEELDYLMTEMYMPQSSNLAPVDYLKQYADGDTDEIIQNSNLANALRVIGRNAELTSGYVNEIIVFTPDGHYLDAGMDGNRWIESGYRPEKDSWYRQTLAMGGQTYIDGPAKKEWLHSDEDSVSFCTALYSVNERTLVGVLVIDCNPAFMREAFINAHPGILSFQLLRNTGEKSKTALKTASYTNSSQADHGEKADVLADNPDSLRPDFSEEDCEIFRRDLDFYGLRLVVMVDRHLMRQEMGFEYYRFFVLVLICLASTILLSFVIAGNVSRPIIELSRRMRGRDGIHGMDVTDLAAFEREDEIGTLYNSYQHMLEEQRDYEKNELENKLILLDAQMQALESQINAHFLYNTLESINSIASVHHVDDISRMATALGRMFRYSIRTESELVALSDELQHVEDYMTIQMIRFDRRFSYEAEVAEPVRKTKVLKLILQPLVENAVLHGLSGKKKGGAVIVSAEYASADLLKISVRDNGSGMDAQTREHLCEQINRREGFVSLGHREDHGGIGLKNLNTRLQLYYGANYHMDILSEPGRGTDITLYIPIQEER